MLFNLFMNDLELCLTSRIANTDDTKLVSVVKTVRDSEEFQRGYLHIWRVNIKIEDAIQCEQVVVMHLMPKILITHTN